MCVAVETGVGGDREVLVLKAGRVGGGGGGSRVVHRDVGRSLSRALVNIAL